MTDLEKIRAWLDEWSPAWNQVKPESQLLSICRILLDVCEVISTGNPARLDPKWLTEGMTFMSGARKAIADALKIVEE